MSCPTIPQDYISSNLSPVLMNNYGQNVLGSTYNSLEFIYGEPGALKCQVKQPFNAVANMNLADFSSNQILQIRPSCPRQGHIRHVCGNLYKV